MEKEATQPERGPSWDGVLRREVACSVRVLSEDDRSVEVIASTEALDAHGDVVKQFWNLDRYNKNGPVLWHHNVFESSPYSFGGAVRPEDLMPVGKGEDVRVESKKLVAKLTLVKGTADEEPFVDKLWRRIRQGVIKAVSVGFKPGQVNRVLNAAGGTDHFELGSAERPNELREISFVPMGSNPEAVAKSISWERKHLRQLAGTETADSGEENEPMAMTAEEKAEMDKLRVAVGVAEKGLEDANAKVVQLQADLTAEKTVSEKLTTDLAVERKKSGDLEAEVAKSSLDARQGVKFAPTEREELEKLVTDVGIKRVNDLLDKRDDIPLTQRVTGDDGENVADKNKKAPETTPEDASADLANEASKRAKQLPAA